MCCSLIASRLILFVYIHQNANMTITSYSSNYFWHRGLPFIDADMSCSFP
ncbi:hypothetical protein M758_7G159500 [Ceratodon purpureus]|nr:hypothetical protein KC19_N015200 [Ceratodon purpureus]KAG0611701.1 hypothetical protein M758_7G159500 [Ceratodon purpureus]